MDMKNISCWFNYGTEGFFFVHQNRPIFPLPPHTDSSRFVFFFHSCFRLFILGHMYLCLHRTHCACMLAHATHGWNAPPGKRYVARSNQRKYRACTYMYIVSASKNSSCLSAESSGRVQITYGNCSNCSSSSSSSSQKRKGKKLRWIWTHVGNGLRADTLTCCCFRCCCGCHITWYISRYFSEVKCLVVMI